MAGACALLGEFGPASPGLGVTPARVIEATGRSRSTLYRHFESASQLNDDLALHLVLAGDGWQRRLLDQSPGAALASSLAAALQGSGDFGLTSRCSVPCLPPGGAAAEQITAWEARWLVLLEGWLDRHLEAHGRRYFGVDGRAAAVALAALVEGHLLLDRLWTRPDDVGWHTARMGSLEEKASRLLASITEPGRAEGRPVGDAAGLADSPFSGAKRALLDELAGLVAAAPPDRPGVVVPSRLVAPVRLARRFGVTQRRIYDVWPTATDLNADIVDAIGRRFVDEAEECIDMMLIHGVDTAVMGPHTAVATRAVAGFTGTGATAPDASWFQVTTALHDPTVFDAHVSVTVEATDTMRRLYLAQFWVHGAKLRDDVSFEEYMGTMRAVIVGTQRLVSSQRTLATEASTHRGQPEPLAGLAANLVARSMVTRIEHPTERR